MSRPRRIRIGLVADTHGLFDPALTRWFKRVDRIFHAGDIGKQSVLSRLRAIAPVTAVSGNVDGYARSGLPSSRMVKVAGRRVAIRHVLYEGGRLTPEARAYLEREQPDVCVFGHTHKPTRERFGNTLLVNPGSAGPKRFTLPRGIGLLEFSGRRLRSRLITLPDRAETPMMRKGRERLELRSHVRRKSHHQRRRER